MRATKKNLRSEARQKARGLGKRACLFFALLALAGGSGGLFAQGAGGIQYWVLDFGVGSSNVLVDGMSFGLILDPKLALTPRVMLGNRKAINFSTDGIVALETQAYLRWNFLRAGAAHNAAGIFAQCGLGLLAAYRGADVKQTRGSVLLDAAAGVTIPMSSRWHIEPSVRVGYPFIAGASVTAGLKLPMRQ